MKLRVCALNVNSIINYDRRVALADLIRSNQFNICLLSETKLKNEQSPQFFGFQSFFQSNTSQRGGTAILVDDALATRNFRAITGPIEATYVEIKLNKNWIGFCAFYVNCHGTQLNDFLAFFRGFRSNVLLGGDSNSRLTRWGDSSDNSNGHFLETSSLELNPTIHNPPHGTYLGLAGASHIDKFITGHDFPLLTSATEVIGSFSDHSAIALSLMTPAPHKSYRKILAYDRANMIAYNRFVKTKLEALHIPYEVVLNDANLQALAESIEQILQTATRRFIPSHVIKHFFQFSGTTLRLHREITLQRRLLRSRQRNLIDGAYATIRKQIRQLKTLFMSNIKMDINRFYEEKIKNLLTTNEAFGHTFQYLQKTK